MIHYEKKLFQQYQSRFWKKLQQVTITTENAINQSEWHFWKGTYHSISDYIWNKTNSTFFQVKTKVFMQKMNMRIWKGKIYKTNHSG